MKAPISAEVSEPDLDRKSKPGSKLGTKGRVTNPDAKLSATPPDSHWTSKVDTEEKETKKLTFIFELENTDYVRAYIY